MRAVGVGLQIEEHRNEIAAAWREAVQGDLAGEPALGYAVVPLLRELSLSLRADAAGRKGGRPAGEAFGRCAVLVRSGAEPSRLAREFWLLQRSIWEVLRELGHPVSHEERQAADGWLAEALAAALERVERTWARVASFDRPGQARASTPAGAAAAAAAPVRPHAPTGPPVRAPALSAAAPTAPGSARPANLAVPAPGAARAPQRPPPLPRRSPLVRLPDVAAGAADEVETAETVH